MDWPGIVILLSVVAAILIALRYGRSLSSDFRPFRRRRDATDRPSHEASHYRASGALPRWRD